MKKVQPAIILAGVSTMIACHSTNRLPINNKEKMFTADQIKTAHSKVKSGADFPAYIRDIKALGVTHYEAYVTDGHIDYHGAGNYTTTVPAKYAPLSISGEVQEEAFRKELAAHQHGDTDFPTFINMCAKYGIATWRIRMDKMTCTYYDKAGNEIMVEQIPQ